MTVELERVKYHQAGVMLVKKLVWPYLTSVVWANCVQVVSSNVSGGHKGRDGVAIAHGLANSDNVRTHSCNATAQDNPLPYIAGDTQCVSSLP